MINLIIEYARLQEKPASAPAPAPKSDLIPLNASVAIKPRICKARDLKSTMVTLDYGIVYVCLRWRFCVFVLI